MSVYLADKAAVSSIDSNWRIVVSRDDTNLVRNLTLAGALALFQTVTADLDVMVGDSGAGGVKGLVPAPAAGDAAASKFLKADGTWAVIAGGVTSLNALTGALSIAVGTSGSDVAVSPSGSTVTVNIPDAGASARGVLTTGTQTIAGDKTLTGATKVAGLSVGTQTAAGSVHVQTDAARQLLLTNAATGHTISHGSYIGMNGLVLGIVNQEASGSMSVSTAGLVLINSTTSDFKFQRNSVDAFEVSATAGVTRSYYNATNYVTETVSSTGGLTATSTSSGTSPGFTFVVPNTNTSLNAGGLTVKDSAATARTMVMDFDVTSVCRIGTTTNYALNIIRNGTAVIRINTSDQVGIGGAPAASLSVFVPNGGKVNFTSSGTANSPMQIAASGGTSGIQLLSTSGIGLAIDSSGNSTFGGALSVTGSITATAGVSAGPITFSVLNASPATATLGVYRITDRANKLAYPDGTNWRFVADDAIIS